MPQTEFPSASRRRPFSSMNGIAAGFYSFAKRFRDDLGGRIGRSRRLHRCRRPHRGYASRRSDRPGGRRGDPEGGRGERRRGLRLDQRGRGPALFHTGHVVREVQEMRLADGPGGWLFARLGGFSWSVVALPARGGGRAREVSRAAARESAWAFVEARALARRRRSPATGLSAGCGGDQRRRGEVGRARLRTARSGEIALRREASIVDGDAHVSVMRECHTRTVESPCAPTAERIGCRGDPSSAFLSPAAHR